jgi:hypothetical protein|nr:MAG TPA: hypothetical protein [Caudoviricetes sp.]
MKKFTAGNITGFILTNGWAKVEFVNEGWKYDIPTKVLFDYMENKIHDDVVIQCGEYVDWDNGEPITKEELLKDTLKMYENGEFSTFEAVTTEFKSKDDIFKALAGVKNARIETPTMSIRFTKEEYFTFIAFVVGAWEMGEKLFIKYEK